MGTVLQVIMVFAIIGFIIAVWGTIFTKAGYSFWRGLFMFIPLVNLVVLIMFATKTWPIQSQLSRLNVTTGLATPDDLRERLNDGMRAEVKGDVQSAVKAYEEIIQVGQDAQASLAALRQKIGS